MIAGISRFVWVSDVADYAAYLGHIGSGIVPILAPDSLDRRRRWSEILTWYGLSEADASEHREAERARGWVGAPHVEELPNGGLLVVALDSDVRPIAEAYARVTERKCARFEDIKDRLDCTSGRQLPPVVVVASASALSFRMLCRLREHFGNAWSILCGRDLPALSFLIAKQLISVRHTVAYPSIAVDAIARNVCTYEGLATTAREFTAAAAFSLASGYWLNLGLLAHGEGSHLNLNEVVCCGSTTRERDANGPIAGGCDGADGDFCKRAEPGQKVIRFGDLKAQFVGLFSCIGFSATGEIYSSDSSLILDGIDGYPTAITTSDRILRMISSLPFLWLALRTGHHPMLEILDLLNDVQARYEGVSPFLLVGDPWIETGGSGRRQQPANENRLQAHIIAAAEGGVLRYDTQSNRGVLLTGLTRAVLMSFPASSADEPPRMPVPGLRDDFDAIRGELERQAEALLTASSIERSLRLALETTTGALDQLNDLSAVRAKIETAIDRGLYHWHQAQTCGVWGDQLDASLATIQKDIGDWDIRMADLAENYLLNRSIEDLLGVGRRVSAVKAGELCQRCNSVMRVESRVPAFHRAPLFHRVDCPLCGCHELFFDGGIRLAGEVPAELIAETTASMPVRLIEHPTIPAKQTKGYLLARMTDRGVGRQVFAERLQIDGPATVEFLIPKSLTPELHIVKCVVVWSLSVAYLRFRAPGRAVERE